MSIHTPRVKLKVILMVAMVKINEEVNWGKGKKKMYASDSGFFFCQSQAETCLRIS